MNNLSIAGLYVDGRKASLLTAAIALVAQLLQASTSAQR